MIEVMETKITNGDRIRSMSDEEMALLITCPNETGYAEILCSHSCNCRKCCYEWLQQEEERERENH